MQNRFLAEGSKSIFPKEKLSMNKLQSTLATVFTSPPTASAIAFILSNQSPQGLALFLPYS
jgi:hypothetical protein